MAAMTISPVRESGPVAVSALAETAPLASEAAVPGATEWQGPWASSRSRRERRWRALLWTLLFPPRGHRITPTLTGVLLIAVSLGIGTAAYNTANNILFITLSLLLSCLILSGVLSWLNLRGVAWRLHAAGPWRAGQTQTAVLELRNSKKLLPTYGLWFDLAAGSEAERRHLGIRLDPGAKIRLEWAFKVARRGRLSVQLRSTGSLFPFGFLHKVVASDLARQVLVWPAVVDYRLHLTAADWRLAPNQGEVNRAGHGGDLLALRRYAPGDSPRIVHWKASARTRQLLVRQFAAEGHEGYALHVDSDAELWPRPEQFELALGLAATLAEDLYKQERLRSVSIDDEPPQAVRRLRDVESFLDRLALLERKQPSGDARPSQGRLNGPGSRRVLRIEPQGVRGAAAILDGKPAATA